MLQYSNRTGTKTTILSLVLISHHLLFYFSLFVPLAALLEEDGVHFSPLCLQSCQTGGNAKQILALPLHNLCGTESGWLLPTHPSCMDTIIYPPKVLRRVHDTTHTSFKHPLCIIHAMHPSYYFLGRNLSFLCSTATDACAEARNQLLKAFPGHAASDGPVPSPCCKTSMGLRRLIVRVC